MKIAVIRSECSYTKGGAERYAANLCRELVSLGHQVWVLAEKFDPKIHPDLIYVPIKVNHSTSWSKNYSFNKNSQEALKGLNADLVLALSRSYPADAFRVSDPLHRFWMKVRYPGRFHRFLQTLNPRHRAILNLENQILDPANTRMIITNSALSKKIIREYYDYPDERIHVIYNGVDHEQFFPLIKPSEKGRPTQLLFVGQDFKRKGLADVIRALAIVRDRGGDCSLRVIGRDRPAPYRALAIELGIGAYVHFEGPTKMIQAAYRAADLFVFPTHYDPFANVCLEAMACGLPVITTTTNGASEVIDEGIDGYVVGGAPASLVNQLSEKIFAFQKLDVASRETMKRAAAMKASRFTIRANAEAVIEALITGKDGLK